jgi:hypothetical protein
MLNVDKSSIPEVKWILELGGSTPIRTEYDFISFIW